MAWDPKFPAFGVIKIDGKTVKMYSSRDNYNQPHFYSACKECRMGLQLLKCYAG